ncbi:MAG: dihydroorotase [Methylococcales bacterium]|nr:dihydroorotase [Methylococcales bacterium]
MTAVLITGGRIIAPANAIDKVGDLFIKNNRIISLFDRPNDFTAVQTINAKDHIVCPGLIDLSAHLREPGQTQKATILSETTAALKSGITTLCCPPDTHPINDTPAVTEFILDKVEHANAATVLPIGALTQGLEGTKLSAMAALHKAGCIGFSNAHNPIKNTLVLRRTLEYAASHNLCVIIRPEDPWLQDQGCVHEGIPASRFGLPGIPKASEIIAIQQSLALCELTGCRIHFSQLSCSESVNLLKAAKHKQLPVSADVAIHQLFFTENELNTFDSALHVRPPFRTETDKQALLDGLKGGVIDAVCSAHQPHDADAKLGAFPSTQPGISALETLLPLILKLIETKALSLSQGISWVTQNPASILALKQGSLTTGSPADICIFNPELTWTVNENNWLSQGRNTPLWGQTIKGKATQIIKSGQVFSS